MSVRTWSYRLAVPLIAVLGMTSLTATTAEAAPTGCSTKRIDHDTFTGTCTGGSGTWRLRVDCSRGEPDSFSEWLRPGRTASEGCTWGRARGASIESRN
ncbi:hypothetical protein [Streptomyces syringium]|uniref:hypothetical protein n=1 Tax=Streptomyces syringium TaxID=76729 RepID=UPI0033C990E3